MVRRPKYLLMCTCLCENSPISSLFLTSPFSCWRLELQIWGLAWILFFLGFLIQDSSSDNEWKNRGVAGKPDFLYLVPQQKISSHFESDLCAVLSLKYCVRGAGDMACVAGVKWYSSLWMLFDIPMWWAWMTLKMSIDKHKFDKFVFVFWNEVFMYPLCLHFFLKFYLPKFVMHDCNFSWQEAIFHTCI